MYEAHVNLIHHGRAICHAQSPKHDAVPGPRPLPLRRQGAPDRAPIGGPMPDLALDDALTDLLDADFASRRSPPAASA